MKSTLKDSFQKVRAFFFLPFFIYISVHSTVEPSLSTIMVET